MKREIIYAIFICISLTRCTFIDDGYNFERVTDSMSYKQILGTYTFTPDKYQARKLNLKMTDTVMLNVTEDSLRTRDIKEITFYDGNLSEQKDFNPIPEYI
ncbi:hypothetical protein [Pedobacter chinensis]|nr:hypothetical protein [Pedobacter chinensis]